MPVTELTLFDKEIFDSLIFDTKKQVEVEISEAQQMFDPAIFDPAFFACTILCFLKVVYLTCSGYKNFPLSGLGFLGAFVPHLCFFLQKSTSNGSFLTPL